MKTAIIADRERYLDQMTSGKTIKMTANQTAAATWAIESITTDNATKPRGSKTDVPRILGEELYMSGHLVAELDLSSVRDNDIDQFLRTLSKSSLMAKMRPHLIIDRRSIRGLARKVLNYQLGF